MIRAIIIDDEQSGINILSILLQKYADQIKVVKTVNDDREAIEQIENYRPDLVFMDVSMPHMSGFDILDKLEYKDFVLIFTTAHAEYAIQAIKNKAFDYLLKPIDADELDRCIKDVISEKRVHPSEHKLPFKTLELSVKDGILFLKQKDIVQVEADGNYTSFYLDGKIKHHVSRSLKEYEDLLDPDLFFRCHNSHIINLDKVEKYISNEGFFVKMNDGTQIPVSRSKKEGLIEKLKGR